MDPHTSGSANDWPADWLAALSDEALIEASSKAIFGRGKTYAQADVIEVMNEDPLPEPALRAQISGSELYETSVWIEDDELEGDCDCPHAAEGWFCKHQVALALVWRERLSGAAPEVDEAARKKVAASAKRGQTLRDKHQRLQDFLHAQAAADLADKLLALAERDHALMRELHHWQKLSTTQGDPAELKAIITDILAPGSRFIDYGETYAYVRRAEAVLPLLEKACQRDAASAVGLAIHALERSWRVLEQADDSDGEIGGFCVAIGEVFVAALQGAGPQAERFGKTYLQLVLEDPFGCFDTAAAEDAIGPVALANFRQTLAAQWRKAKDAALAQRASKKGRPRYEAYNLDPHDWNLAQLERLHLAQLERAGEIETAISVLKEDLSDDDAHTRLIRLLDKHGRHREAFAAAEAANKAFPGQWRLEEILLDFYRRDGWSREAFALLQQRFARQPDVRGYQAVLAAGTLAGEEPSRLRQTLMEDLAAREQAALKQPRGLRYANAASETGPYVSLRAEILVSEKRWLEACTLVQPPALCEAGVLRKIALHLPASHTDEAVTLLRRVFDYYMRTASSPYREPLELVREIIARLEEAPRRVWLENLRATYKAKRNFIRDLPLE